MVIRRALSPFKGVCDSCRRRVVVRLYPYNDFEWLGVLCLTCYSIFVSAMESYVDVYEDFE